MLTTPSSTFLIYALASAGVLTKAWKLDPGCLPETAAEFIRWFSSFFSSAIREGQGEHHDYRMEYMKQQSDVMKVIGVCRRSFDLRLKLSCETKNESTKQRSRQRQDEESELRILAHFRSEDEEGYNEYASQAETYSVRTTLLREGDIR